MKYFSISILISFLAFFSQDAFAQLELIRLLEKVNELNFTLKNFEKILEEKYCSKHLFRNIEGLDCKLSNSVRHGLHTNRIHTTTETVELIELAMKETKAISLVLSKYGKDRIKAHRRVKEDYKKIAIELKYKFTFINEFYREGGESPEILTAIYSNDNGAAIQVKRLIGGCFGDQRIIISIFEKGKKEGL